MLSYVSSWHGIPALFLLQAFSSLQWGADPQDLTGMVANYVPGPLGTQYGTLIFAHSSQVLVAWMLMFTKGQDVSWTLASNSLFF